MSKGINVHIYPSTMQNNTRLFKEARALEKADFFDEIHLVGLLEGDLPATEKLSDSIIIHRMKMSWYKRWPIGKTTIFFLEWYFQLAKMYRNQHVRAIQAHSLPDLPVATMLKWKKRCKTLIYDSHELATETHELQGFRKRIAKLKERFWIRYAKEVITVSYSIYDWYIERYPKAKINLVKNIPEAPKVMPVRSGKIREQLGINDDLLFLYLGFLRDGRSVEDLVEVFRKQPHDRHILFVGYGPLFSYVEEFSKTHPNIHILPAVPFNEILGVAADADVGIIITEQHCLNHLYCLPNKFYEYMYSGLAVVYSNGPDMVQEMSKSNHGWPTGTGSEAIAKVIEGITKEEVEAKRPKQLPTDPDLTWAKQAEVYTNIYRRALFPQ